MSESALLLCFLACYNRGGRGFIMIRVYLDNCCFNRPYDEQCHLKVRLETQAKLSIQQWVLDKKIELIWSFILAYENDKNPHMERRKQINVWRSYGKHCMYFNG